MSVVDHRRGFRLVIRNATASPPWPMTHAFQEPPPARLRPVARHHSRAGFDPWQAEWPAAHRRPSNHHEGSWCGWNTRAQICWWGRVGSGQSRPTHAHTIVGAADVALRRTRTEDWQHDSMRCSDWGQGQGSGEAFLDLKVAKKSSRAGGSIAGVGAATGHMAARRAPVQHTHTAASCGAGSARKPYKQKRKRGSASPGFPSHTTPPVVALIFGSPAFVLCRGH